MKELRRIVRKGVSTAVGSTGKYCSTKVKDGGFILTFLTGSFFAVFIPQPLPDNAPTEGWVYWLLILKQYWVSIVMIVGAVGLTIAWRVLHKNSFDPHKKNFAKEDSPMNQTVRQRFAKVPLGGSGTTKLWLNNAALPLEGFALEDGVSNSSTAIGSISGAINARAFTGSTWETTVEDKIGRNTSHSLRNKRCLKVLSVTHAGVPVHFGMSHVLPLTKEGYAEYIAGNVPDNTFPADYIAKEGEPFEALLLFTWIVDSPLPEGAPIDHMSCLLRALHFHIRELMTTGNIARTKLLVQNDRQWFLAWLEEEFAFQHRVKRTYDNNPLLEVEAELRAFDW
ncbi:MAG: hypothetical protein IPN38_11790 [Flavobacteriales bacterium]|nr:hypothetical protein [Flavobacteriales bacterium]